MGGGKSAVARNLAAQLRAAGQAAAAIDLDLLYLMRDETYADDEVWRTTRRGAAALADAFFAADTKAVIVESGFFTQDELDGLLKHIATDVRLMFVTLRVSFEQALHRVQTDPDPGRVASKVPETLRWLHNQFVEALPFLTASGLVLDADLLAVDELVKCIVQSFPEDVRAT